MKFTKVLKRKKCQTSFKHIVKSKQKANEIHTTPEHRPQTACFLKSFSETVSGTVSESVSGTVCGTS